MDSSLFSGDHDLHAMRDLITRNAAFAGVIDFEEQILLSTVRETARLWRSNAAVVGFAYVDDRNNLWFETDRDCDSLDLLGSEIVAWGTECVRLRSRALREMPTLDSCCAAEDSYRIGVLQQHGFVPQEIRALRYSRPLSAPIPHYPLPEGFLIRSVRIQEEVTELVALHQAAFGTANMTVEQRLAMSGAPHYRQDLDLVAVAPNGELAAFCVCGWYSEKERRAHTDPIGTHPRYQRLGLGKALLSAGLRVLRQAGAHVVELGTSSENTGMRALAAQLGFVRVAERLWFSRVVS